jgi:type I restriction enzyme, S subunit
MSAPRGCDADPPADELPSGWAWVPVERLAANETGALTDGPFGTNLKTSHYEESGPRVIRLQNIGDGVFHDERAHITREHFEELRRHEAKGQDVVVAMLGETLPRACLVPDHVGPAIVKADCARLRVDPGFALPRLVAAGLNSPSLRRQADELVHGVGRPRLGLRWLKTLQFPLAPLPEQHRIVEAIESYFTRLDDAVATLDRVQRNLKRYRASVLKAAVEGRLVPTEAELARAEGRDYEPASVLLERILAERRRRWEEAGGRGTYQEPVAPETSALPELPPGWCWAVLDQVGDVSGGLTKNAKRAAHEKVVPYLRVANVYADELRLDDVSEIGIRDSEMDKLLLEKGDLLVVEGNGSIDQIGRVAVWDGSIDGCVHQNHLIKVRFCLVSMGAWALRWLLSPGGRQAIEREASSTSGLHTLSISKVARLPIPLCPLAEQGRITSEVERLLSIASASSEISQSNEKRAARLRQSILKWAFEGRLADQDPSDEPASVLLERIRSQALASRLSAGDTGDRQRRRGDRRSSVRAENKP